MQVPKLQRVEEQLNRVEQTQPELLQTKLELTIAANELIIPVLMDLMGKVSSENPPLAHVLHTKVDEINETLGEQQLSFQLLRLLEITKGQKGLAAQWLKNALDQVYGNINQYL